MIGLSLPPKAPIMSTYDDFEPRLGRLGDKGQKPRPRKFLSRVIAAANLARGGAPGRARQSAFTGSRIGRGAGVGRVLSSRDRFTAFRQRRAIVKVRTVKRSEEHTSELQSLMRISYAVFCLKKKKN